MKPLMSLITTLSFLLWFSFTITKPSCASAVEQVLDVNGDPLVPGQWYHMVSSGRGAAGGGVSPWPLENPSCASSVVLIGLGRESALPMRFQVPFISSGPTNLEIEFVWWPRCVASSKWVAAYNESESSLSSAKLVIGGAENHPDSTLVSGYFQLEKFPGLTSAYKLVFCPKSSDSSSGTTCYVVGLGEGRQLALGTGNRIFLAVFVKANIASGNGKSII